MIKENHQGERKTMKRKHNDYHQVEKEVFISFFVILTWILLSNLSTSSFKRIRDGLNENWACWSTFVKPQKEPGLYCVHFFR